MEEKIEGIINELFTLHVNKNRKQHKQLVHVELRVLDDRLKALIDSQSRKYAFKIGRDEFLEECIFYIYKLLNNKPDLVDNWYIGGNDREQTLRYLMKSLRIDVPKFVNTEYKLLKDTVRNGERIKEYVKIEAGNIDDLIINQHEHLIQDFTNDGYKTAQFISWFRENKHKFLKPSQLKFLEVAPHYLTSDGTIKVEVLVESGHSEKNKVVNIQNRIKERTLKAYNEFLKEYQQELQLKPLIKKKRELEQLLRTSEESVEKFERDIMLEMKQENSYIEDLMGDKLEMKHTRNVLQAIKYKTFIPQKTLDRVLEILTEELNDTESKIANKRNKEHRTIKKYKEPIVEEVNQAGEKYYKVHTHN